MSINFIPMLPHRSRFLVWQISLSALHDYVILYASVVVFGFGFQIYWNRS